MMLDRAWTLRCFAVVSAMVSACCSLNSNQRRTQQDLYSGQFTTTAEGTKNFFNLTSEEIKNNRRNRRQKLIVSTVLEEPYMMLRENGLFLTENDRFEGFVADIFRRIGASLGIEYELRLSSDSKYGDLQSDGSWDGTIGEVIRGVVDVAAGPLTVTDQRRQFVEFTESFLSLRSSALLKKPPSPGDSPPKDGQPADHPHHPRLTNGEQLLTTDHVYGVLRDSPVQALLSTSRDPTHRAMWARMAGFWPTTIVDSVQEGVERVRGGGERFAFIVESPTAEYLATRRPCDLYATEPFLDRLAYAFAVRRGEAALRAALDGQLRRMADSSELQMLYLRWWKDECAGHGGHRPPPKVESSGSVPRRSNSTAIVASRSVGGRRYGNGADRPAAMATSVATTLLLLLLPFLRILRY